MKTHEQLLYDIEVHSVEGIRSYFAMGGDPNELFNGIPLFTTMVEMYFRSPGFKECIRVFIDNGLKFEDSALLAVLADEPAKLKAQILADERIVQKRHSLFNNTFTPLTDATLLHYCAEYNHVSCAKVLIDNGADINALTGSDENGFGGPYTDIPCGSPTQ